MHHSELLARRRKLGLSQAGLGARLGIQPNTIALWERGELRMEHSRMLQLALKYLECEQERDSHKGADE